MIKVLELLGGFDCMALNKIWQQKIMISHEKEISYIGTSRDNSSLLASISSKVFHILAKSGSRVRNCMSRLRIIIWINFNLLELSSSKFSSSKLSVKNKEMMYYSYHSGYQTIMRGRAKVSSA